MAARSQASPPKQSRADEPSFEVALEKLEGIVDRLETGGIELEEALEAFEQGVSLSRRCAEQLDIAERRVEVLVSEGRELITRPLAAPEAEEEQE